jgi:hypothetical protein
MFVVKLCLVGFVLVYVVYTIVRDVKVDHIDMSEVRWTDDEDEK